MAGRLIFKSCIDDEYIYKEEYCDFTYYNGFAISQKQKSIKSFHDSIRLKYPNSNILEISTKSDNFLGVNLSAFNLSLYDEELGKAIPLENIFQSAKVFEHGGPYYDLKIVSPKDAKRDLRLRNSGNLKSFQYNNKDWSLNPKTMFYDWIYIKALNQDDNLKKEILKYDIFTDIEFNDKKSINCQARSAAIFVSLSKRGLIDNMLSNLELFKTIYRPTEMEQLSFF